MTPDTAHICSKGTLDSPQQFLGVSPCSWPEHLTSQFFVVVVVQSLSHVQLFATPWTAAHQASLSITNSQSLFKLTSIESVMPSNHLVLCYALLLLSSIFPSIRVFSNELALHIRWPKYWSFSISPSNKYSGLDIIIMKTRGGENRMSLLIR